MPLELSPITPDSGVFLVTMVGCAIAGVFAILEFLYGTRQSAKDAGKTWLEEMRGELDFIFQVEDYYLLSRSDSQFDVISVTATLGSSALEAPARAPAAALWRSCTASTPTPATPTQSWGPRGRSPPPTSPSTRPSHTTRPSPASVTSPLTPNQQNSTVRRMIITILHTSCLKLK